MKAIPAEYWWNFDFVVLALHQSLRKSSRAHALFPETLKFEPSLTFVRESMDIFVFYSWIKFEDSTIHVLPRHILKALSYDESSLVAKAVAISDSLEWSKGMRIFIHLPWSAWIRNIINAC